jgi:hypothetical protein
MPVPAQRPGRDHNIWPQQQIQAGLAVTADGGPSVSPGLRGYSAIKGPLAVAPMFPNNSRRIAALITVICLALLTSDSPATTGQPPGIPQPQPLQARLLNLLNVAPTQHHDQMSQQPARRSPAC